MPSRKRSIGALLWNVGLTRLTQFCRTGRLLILRYHSVCADDASPEYVSKSISVPASMFRRQMQYLASRHTCLSLSEAASRLSNGGSLPPRSVVVTFDDGYLDNYQYAMPALVEHRVPATIYLVSSTLKDKIVLWTSRLRYALAHSTTDTVRLPSSTEVLPVRSEHDRTVAASTLTNSLNRLPSQEREGWLDQFARDCGVTDMPGVDQWFLNPGQIAEMQSHRIEFGAHTVTHPNLPGLDRSEARFEVQQSRADLESILGSPVVHFWYPNSGALYPHFDAGVTELTRAAGFRTAVTSVAGSCSPESNLLQLPRLGINRGRSPMDAFAIHIEKARLGL